MTVPLAAPARSVCCAANCHTIVPSAAPARSACKAVDCPMTEPSAAPTRSACQAVDCPMTKPLAVPARSVCERSIAHDRAIDSARAVGMQIGRLPHERATGRFRAACSPAGLHEQAAHARQKFIIGSILLFTSAQITHIIIIWSAVHFNGYGGSLHEKYPAR